MAILGPNPPVIVEGFDLTAHFLQRKYPWYADNYVGRGVADLIGVGQSDLDFFIAFRDGVYVMESTERSAIRQGEGSFSDLGTAVRFLVATVDTLNLPLERWKAMTPKVPGVTVEKTPVSTRLEWSNGWAELLHDTYVDLLARSIGHSLEELAASMEHPDGAPLFLT